MGGKSCMQLTLALIKPDAAVIPYVVQSIYSSLLAEKFLIIRRASFHLSQKEAQEFYIEHKGRFFYNRLVNFMSSGPLEAMVLYRADCIAHWRKLMGPTKVFQSIYSDPLSIRGAFGLTDTRNTTHGSDSPTTALKEMKLFFPEFDVDAWRVQEEPLLRSGSYILDEKAFVHRPL
ncbi:Nucleoside diphosphate kinase-like domain [Trinorchestia longiramus]|nr:Nucleoside diphosphate kinase-like domain [Trinorchestia longiramus]